MSSHAGAVEEMNLPLNLSRVVLLPLQLFEHSLPDALFLPAIEAAGGSLPRAVALGQVTPGGARAQDPKDGVEDSAMVLGWTTAPRFLWEQQRSDFAPLLLGKLFASHSSSLKHFANRP